MSCPRINIGDLHQANRVEHCVTLKCGLQLTQMYANRAFMLLRNNEEYYVAEDLRFHDGVKVLSTWHGLTTIVTHYIASSWDSSVSRKILESHYKAVAIRSVNNLSAEMLNERGMDVLGHLHPTDFSSSILDFIREESHRLALKQALLDISPHFIIPSEYPARRTVVVAIQMYKAHQAGFPEWRVAMMGRLIGEFA